jgi:hypothetical protein
MSNTSFLVIETKNGSLSPRSVWTASSEADYVQRVCANAARSDTSGIVTASDAAAFDSERSAMRVEFMTEEQFNQFDLKCLELKVLAQAERLRWFTAPTDGECDE